MEPARTRQRSLTSDNKDAPTPDVHEEMGYEVKVVADSGSPYTFMIERKWKECFAHIEIKESHIKLVGYGGKPVEVLGECEVEFSFQGSTSKGIVYVARDDTCLLGWDDQKSLGILLDPNNPDQVILSKNYKRVLSVKNTTWQDEFLRVFKEELGLSIDEEPHRHGTQGFLFLRFLEHAIFLAFRSFNPDVRVDVR
ncbi:hypothetical protein NDU88_000263 [Pleurodeles waltl]|uniref:Uncharacterized protein n=1 Tax=Pleurodeles waltl TaxID=8319 RepID=A0AAV7UPG7_PLEWA|nr:hypothetical protein NDU88_000263 [Pleurodeles waltl]